MDGSGPRTRRSAGFTLVETMVAATVLMVGVLGTLTMLQGAEQTARANSARTAAANLSREILEQARALSYSQLAPSTLVSQLRQVPSLTGTVDAGGNWTISRRGVKLTVRAQVCTFDDPMDGLAALPPANACPAAAAVAGAPVEANPDDFRRLTLTLRWAEGDQHREAVQSGMVVNPGGGQGPRITSFPDPFLLQVTAGVSVPFVVNTTAAASVRWTADDGISMGDAIGGPTGWTFLWNLGTPGVGTWVVDGTYTVKAQPFDARGVPGEMRVANVLLNRRSPLAPQQVQGGRSDAFGGVVELEWLANRERDVLGYRVYRRTLLGGRTRICPAEAGDAVTTRTTCQDRSPDLALSTYQVVAVDRPTVGDPASGTREGDATTLVVPTLGIRPGKPTALTASVVDGRVNLSWTPPSATVLFYRIYRDGERLDRTVTALPSYVDAAPGEGSHTYQVSAVGLTFNESELSSPVTVAAP